MSLYRVCIPRPSFKVKNGKINFAISGDVFLRLLERNLEIEEGECYKSYILDEEDQIDIISTKKFYVWIFSC